jgi:uncharacterized protein (DUF1330 family)
MTCSTSAVASVAVWAQHKAPVYAVIDVTKTMDAQAYMKAVSASEPNSTQSAGGRFLIRTSKAIPLDGAAPPDRFVVIAFDSEEQAKSWYSSPTARKINAVRMKVTKSRAFLVEGLAN